MGNEGRVLIDNLGSFYLILVCIALYLALYMYLLTLGQCSMTARKLSKRIAKQLFWSSLLVFGLEGYQDITMSVLVNW
jgi:hypothetical protein